MGIRNYGGVLARGMGESRSTTRGQVSRHPGSPSGYCAMPTPESLSVDRGRASLPLGSPPHRLSASQQALPEAFRACRNTLSPGTRRDLARIVVPDTEVDPTLVIVMAGLLAGPPFLGPPCLRSTIGGGRADRYQDGKQEYRGDPENDMPPSHDPSPLRQSLAHRS